MHQYNHFVLYQNYDIYKNVNKYLIVSTLRRNQVGDHINAHIGFDENPPVWRKETLFVNILEINI